MAYAIGTILAVVVALFARVVGFDRDRSFYPTVVIVVAAYYVLFAVMSGSVPTLIVEMLVMGGFALLAVVGFRFDARLVAVALAGHGVFDFFHGHVVANSGVPEWWPAFCMSYDLCAGGILAWFWRRSDRPQGDRNAGAEGGVR